MKLLKNFTRNFILRSDMFAAQPTLRFNGQASYETIFGGCLSILLVVGFAVIFSRSFINVLQKVNVSASLNIQDNPYDDSQLSNIRMAIGIKGLDFNSSQRYFNIILKVQNAPLGGSPTQSQIQLSPCQYDDWKDEGERFDKLFQVYQMQKMLCPSPNQNLTLKGFGGSSEWVTMSVMVQQCRNGTSLDWTCHTPMNILKRFNAQLVNADFFKLNFLVLNTVISPQQENSTKKVLQNQIFITFSNTSGSRCQLKLGKYQITTDNSIWPIELEQSEQGYYITSHDTYSINLYSTHYVRIEIQKARTIYQVTRAHDKIDNMLSYVGGLFALLFGWIFFFISSYNQYKYEISVAQNAFALDQTGRKTKQDQFGFWTYLKYSFFDWIKTFGITLNWKRMQEIDAARQQATEQMDIRYLMKKVQRFQAINKFLLGQHNLIYANLARPPTLDQVKRLRKITEYYDKVIKIQNQQNLLMNILKDSNQNSSENNKIQNNFNDKNLQTLASVNTNIVGVKKKDNNQNIQLDSDDEQIQRQIAQIYKNELKNHNQNQLTEKILQQIPQMMKQRLLSLNYESEANQSKCKLKIQSTVTLNQSVSTPNPFISKLMNNKRLK